MLIRIIVFAPFWVSSFPYSCEVVIFSLPEDEFDECFLDLILSNDPSRIDIIDKLLFGGHENFYDMRTRISASLFELTEAFPFSFFIFILVYGSSLIQPHSEDSSVCLDLIAIFLSE